MQQLILLGLIGCTGYAAYEYFGINKKILARFKKKHNIISILHNTNHGSNNYISTTTSLDFIKTYDNSDHDKEISLVIQTHGGSLCETEIISNCILNHSKSKINCYIPHYSQSGGCAISLCCDKIYMTKNAVLGPCDAQCSVEFFSRHSVPAIMSTVKYKKDNDQKISEDWLAAEHEATLVLDRQRCFVDKLIKIGKYKQEAADKIYEEFFSGKYNHDKIFTAQEAKEIGLNITIVDELPDFVTKMLKKEIVI